MMKKIIVAVFAVSMLASCSNPNHQESTQPLTENNEAMEKLEKEKIEALLATYEKSLNTSDAELAQSLYAKDGIFMPAGAPSGIGAEAILNSYKYVFSQIQLNIQFFIEEIQVEGKMAFAVTGSKGTTLIHATGETIPEENRELFVFEKVGEEWKIARYMFNKTK